MKSTKSKGSWRVYLGFSLDFTRCTRLELLDIFRTLQHGLTTPKSPTHTSMGISPHTVRVTHFQLLPPTIQPSTSLLFFHLRNTQGLSSDGLSQLSAASVCEACDHTSAHRFMHVFNRNSSHGSPIGWGVTSPGQDARLKEKSPDSRADCPPRH